MEGVSGKIGDEGREGMGRGAYLAFELYLLFIVVWRIPFREAGFSSDIGHSLAYILNCLHSCASPNLLPFILMSTRSGEGMSQRSEDWTVGIRTADSGLE